MRNWLANAKESVITLFAYVVAASILLAILGGILIALVRPTSDVPDGMFSSAAAGVGIVLGALLGYRAGGKPPTGEIGTNPGKSAPPAAPPIDQPGTTD